MTPSFIVLKKGGYLFENTANTFLSMIIYICILKISIIWINPVICHLLQNKVLTTSMSNLSFLDNECIKSSFMLQTLKKKKIKSTILSLKSYEKKTHPQFCSSAHQLLQGHSMFADFKMFIL